MVEVEVALFVAVAVVVAARSQTVHPGFVRPRPAKDEFGASRRATS